MQNLRAQSTCLLWLGEGVHVPASVSRWPSLLAMSVWKDCRNSQRIDSPLWSPPKTLAQGPHIRTCYMCNSVAGHTGLEDALGEGCTPPLPQK